MSRNTTSTEQELRSQYNLPTIRIAAPSDRTALSANDSHEGNVLMGEVRVTVRLTNAGDEVLVRRGLLTVDQIRSYEADALVDTGAVRSVLPIHVVQLLGLAIVDRVIPNPAHPDQPVIKIKSTSKFFGPGSLGGVLDVS